MPELRLIRGGKSAPSQPVRTPQDDYKLMKFLATAVDQKEFQELIEGYRKLSSYHRKTVQDAVYGFNLLQISERKGESK